jgi:hypothetical protein
MTDQVVPVIGVSYKMQVADGKEVVLQTHVDRDIEQSVLDALVDKLYYACERQVQFSKMATLQNEVDHNARMMTQLSASLGAVDEKYKTRAANAPANGKGRQLSATEQSAREQAIESYKQHESHKVLAERRLAALRMELCPSPAPR